MLRVEARSRSASKLRKILSHIAVTVHACAGCFGVSAVGAPASVAQEGDADAFSFMCPSQERNSDAFTATSDRVTDQKATLSFALKTETCRQVHVHHSYSRRGALTVTVKPYAQLRRLVQICISTQNRMHPHICFYQLVWNYRCLIEQ